MSIPLSEKNELSKVSRTIASALGVEGKYSAHSFRATAATTFIEQGGTKEALKKLGDWKSDTVCEGYVRDSKKMARDAAKILLPENFRPTDS